MTPAQIANTILGALAVILGVLAASQVLPPSWAPYVALALALDTALQRFLPAALGPLAAGAVADPHGSGPCAT